MTKNGFFNKTAQWFIGPLAICLLAFCSKSNLSERDAKREQLRSAAENKRRELNLVAGDFLGTLTQADRSTRSFSLNLTVKDIPTEVEGQVDPVMTPILSGYLKYFFSGGNPNEGIPFPIEKAEFDPTSNRLDIVANHTDYKQLLLGLIRNETELKGTWTAPVFGSSGTAEFHKVTTQSTAIGEQLSGEYSGVLERPNGYFQYAQMTLLTTLVPPEGLKVTAVGRLIFGEYDSTEYLTYRFDKAQYNPLTGQLILKSDTADVSFTGVWANGRVQGEWTSSYTGKMGMFILTKNIPPTPLADLKPQQALRGSYQGSLKNTNPQSNLPERLLLGFVTSQDLSQPNGIKITGNVRFYLGPFGSLEYVEYPMDHIEHNFFTNKLVLKTSGDPKLTFKGEIEGKNIWGTLSTDSLGEVGAFEVTKP